MLYWILYPLTSDFTGFNLVRYISFRTVFAALTAFFVCVVIGPGIIRALKEKKFREPNESPDETLQKLRESKKDTPTMGGLIVLLAIVTSVVLFGRLDNLYVVLGLVTVISFSLIGAADDWVKLTKPAHKGFKPRHKLFLQCLVAAIVVTVLWRYTRGQAHLTELQLPLVKAWTFELGPFYILLGFFVIVGSSNGVNFTDGMDGLAIGGVAMTGLTLLVIAYLVGRVDMSGFLNVIYVPGSGELTVFLGAVVGAGLGFLWFNCFPAQVFMGDTGSLALGATLGYVAVVTRMEFALMIAGMMFVVDGLSVVLQIGSYRLTGKRLLPFAPISNLWIRRGQHEVKVTVRYWIVAALMGALSLVLLKVR
ncbi:MAG: phospho-N-acetylmuramoyl-pentapeptide-transferase [Planctomycetota bacterium]